MTRSAAANGLRHVALLCRGQAEYRVGVTGFIRDALTSGDPVLAAVPPARDELLRAALGTDAGRVSFVDLTEIGRNPASIIPAIRDFTDHQPGGRASVVCEPAWPGRTKPELTETVRHEALVNVAFRGNPTVILCPYDRSGLPRTVLADVRRTHPMLAGQGGMRTCDLYAVPCPMPPHCDEPLSRPPRAAESLWYDADLRAVRDFVARRAARAGLPGPRADDMVLAVSEVAANTLRHTPGPGTLRVWRDGSMFVCQVSDGGWIEDPMAGRWPSVDENLAGCQGLWVVNQICDLVQIRTSPAGSTLRLSMRLGCPPRPRRGLRRLAAMVGRLRLPGCGELARAVT